MTCFINKIYDWYRLHKRLLPWRETVEPYLIWLSEIILQQTRINQGTGYYLRFVEKYPTVKSLADAEEEDVLKLWQGLGYYSRARNLHYTARYIANSLNGRFPETKSELKKLKGVGDYTASAIASIAFNQPEAAVDGNVYRLLSRFLAIATPIDTSEGKKEFAQIADMLLDRENPGLFNQAMMEMGALMCTPALPNCQNCPVATHCLSHANGDMLNYPVKTKKTKVRERYFNYFIIHNDTYIIMCRRERGDIWQGLYDFPLSETVALLTEEEACFVLSKEFAAFSGSLKKESDMRHQLTHQTIHIRFFSLATSLDNNIPTFFTGRNTVLISKNELDKYPVPKPVEKWLLKKTNSIPHTP
ncbi:MAG: A/G-specific adenine glycosylase [Cytophagaceae bacterium]|jgi:A/G-specific adenine glycosylase|nr:A/G-specific adenine glycosylase [Cytophagaceae bacterium]